jgi:hypothetical protein
VPVSPMSAHPQASGTRSVPCTRNASLVALGRPARWCDGQVDELTNTDQVIGAFVHTVPGALSGSPSRAAVSAMQVRQPDSGSIAGRSGRSSGLSFQQAMGAGQADTRSA